MDDKNECLLPGKARRGSNQGGDENFSPEPMNRTNELIVLYVDDEVLSLKYFEKDFAPEFRTQTAANAQKAWAIIQAQPNEIGLVMSDQRLPGVTGVELLTKVRRSYPHITRVLVTAYAEIADAVEAVNAAGIYRYVSKPWDLPELKLSLARGLEFSSLRRERDELMGLKLSALHQMLLLDRARNLAGLAAGLDGHFRNSLAAATDFIQAMPRHFARPNLDEKNPLPHSKNFEAQVRSSNEYLARVAATMWEFAAEGVELPAAPISTAELLQSVMKSGGAGLANGLLLKMDDSLPPLRANARLISKMVLGLASGIRSVAEKERPITLEAKAATGAAKNVTLILRDEGPDWSPEQFSRFFALGSNASGLDASAKIELPVWYFIARHHGGRIQVQGTGDCRVSIELAVDPAATPPPGDRVRILQQLLQGEHGLEELLASAPGRKA